MHAHLEIALVGVENGGGVLVEGALQLHGRVVNGRLEIAVLRIHHQPHASLHPTPQL